MSMHVTEQSEGDYVQQAEQEDVTEVHNEEEVPCTS
jgi:hypothetical protein